jgi:hypothetical protein
MSLYPIYSPLAAVVLPTIDSLEIDLNAELGITKDGSNDVTAWADQAGGTGYTFGSSSGKYPNWADDVNNGLPAVTYTTDEGQWDESTGGPSPSATHWFFVVRFDTIGGGAPFMYDTRGTIHSVRGENTAIVGQYAGAGVGNTLTVTMSTWVLFESMIDGATTSFMSENNGTKATGSDPGAGSTLANIYLMINDNKSTAGIACGVQRMLVYTENLSVDNRAAVQVYLNSYYALGF